MNCARCGTPRPGQSPFCPGCGQPYPADGVAAFAGAPMAGARLSPVPAALALGSGLAVAVGSFMPWASVSAGILSVSASGMDGDGPISLIIGAIAAIVALYALAQNRPHQRIVLGICGVAALGLAALETSNVLGKHTELFGRTISASIGIGLFVIAAGGVGLLVSAFVEARER